MQIRQKGPRIKFIRQNCPRMKCIRKNCPKMGRTKNYCIGQNILKKIVLGQVLSVKFSPIGQNLGGTDFSVTVLLPHPLSFLDT